MSPRLTGSYAALPTPFRPLAGRPLDTEAFAELVARQVEGGSDGVVVAGTTGEAPTLSPDERSELVRTAVEVARGRLTIVAGVGTGDTRTTLARAAEARRAGADALLVVTPPYSRAPQRGLAAHLGAVAAATDLPVVLYDVPSRTAVTLEPETAAAVAREHPNVVAIKLATRDVERVRAFVAGAGLDVLAGDDEALVEACLAGAVGAIGVATVLAPRRVGALVRAACAGDERTALAHAEELGPLIRALGLESNPLPLKAALAELGFAADALRLPLVPLADEHRPALARALGAIGASA